LRAQLADDDLTTTARPGRRSLAAHHGLFRERFVGTDGWPAGLQRHNRENPGNAGQLAAVFSHRVHHILSDLDTANW
jgi:hypothetical protein